MLQRFMKITWKLLQFYTDRQTDRKYLLSRTDWGDHITS